MPEATSFPARCHEEVLRNAPPRESHVFDLITDGSGWDQEKTAIGSAWILKPCPHITEPSLLSMALKGLSGASAGTVQRAELLALLGGLHALSFQLGLLSLAGLRAFLGKPLARVEDFPKANRPTVWWVTDRETIALQVARRPDGSTYYERKVDMDLWCQFYWYECIFAITPVYTPRNTTDAQKQVDAGAGAVRGMFNELATQAK